MSKVFRRWECHFHTFLKAQDQASFFFVNGLTDPLLVNWVLLSALGHSDLVSLIITFGSCLVRDGLAHGPAFLALRYLFAVFTGRVPQCLNSDLGNRDSVMSRAVKRLDMLRNGSQVEESLRRDATGGGRPSMPDSAMLFHMRMSMKRFAEGSYTLGERFLCLALAILYAKGWRGCEILHAKGKHAAPGDQADDVGAGVETGSSSAYHTMRAVDATFIVPTGPGAWPLRFSACDVSSSSSFKPEDTKVLAMAGRGGKRKGLHNRVIIFVKREMTGTMTSLDECEYGCEFTDWVIVEMGRACKEAAYRHRETDNLFSYYHRCTPSSHEWVRKMLTARQCRDLVQSRMRELGLGHKGVGLHWTRHRLVTKTLGGRDVGVSNLQHFKDLTGQWASASNVPEEYYEDLTYQNSYCMLYALSRETHDSLREGDFLHALRDPTLAFSSVEKGDLPVLTGTFDGEEVDVMSPLQFACLDDIKRNAVMACPVRHPAVSASDTVLDILEDLYLEISPGADDSGDEGEAMDESDDEVEAEHVLESMSISGEILTSGSVAVRVFSPGKMSPARAKSIKNKIQHMDESSYNAVGTMSASSTAFFAMFEAASDVEGSLI